MTSTADVCEAAKLAEGFVCHRRLGGRGASVTDPQLHRQEVQSPTAVHSPPEFGCSYL